MKPINYPFVEPEMAKLAKEKGFNEKVIKYYIPKYYGPEGEYTLMYGGDYLGEDDKSIAANVMQGRFGKSFAAPTYQELTDWLEEKHRLKVLRVPFTSGKDRWVIWGWDTERVLWKNLASDYPDQETAIKEAFKLI